MDRAEEPLASSAVGEPSPDPAPYIQRARELFERAPNNPILGVSDMPMACKAVCNPGAIEFEGDVLLLLRVIDEEDHSSLVVARSQNGVDGWRIEKEPLLSGAEWYDEWGCEDARITYLADRAEYVIVYAGSSHFGASVCLATTKDFKTVERIGIVIHPYNKDAVLFPERIDGKYRLLHRPTIAPHEDIWVSESDDLVHWGHPKNVLQESDRPGWKGGKIGAGPPPYVGVHGWVLIYHGVERKDDKWTYRVGMAVLDREHPQRIVRQWPDWVMNPQEAYEFDEKGQGIVFPTGVIRRGGKLLIYYGAGDRSVGLAIADEASLRGVSDEFEKAETARNQS